MKLKLEHAIVLCIAVILVCVYSLAHSQDFIDTTLDSPYTVVNPATTMRQYDFYWGPDSFKASMNFIDSEGNIVAQRVCTLQDWVEIVTPASCSDPQYTDQASCEVNGDVWTPAVTTPHNDFSDGANAVIGAGQVGSTFKSVIAGYIQTRCKAKWSLTGTE